MASGRTKMVQFRRACPKFLRQHHAAIRALAFKWQRILFRRWKHQATYDESQYLAALRSGTLLCVHGGCERSVENEKPPVQKMPSWGLTSKTQKSIRSCGLLPDCQPIYPLAQTSLDRDAHHCSLGRQFVVVKLIRQRVAIMRESRTRTVRGVFLSHWPSPAY